MPEQRRDWDGFRVRWQDPGEQNDTVNHPAHYTQGGIEVIDAIEAWDLNYHLGSVLKYIVRAGHKDPAKHVEDLEKARWFLEREIARVTLEGKG